MIFILKNEIFEIILFIVIDFATISGTAALDLIAAQFVVKMAVLIVVLFAVNAQAIVVFPIVEMSETDMHILKLHSSKCFNI